MKSYYEPAPTSGFCPGQIVWMPCLYPEKDPMIIDIDVSSDPSEERLPATLSPIKQKQFKVPIKSLNLASDESLFAVRGKRRPAVVLAQGFTRWPTLSSEQLLICTPIFSVDKKAIRQEFVISVQAFHYTSKFYLPPDVRYGFQEGVARLEVTQVAHQRAVEPYPDAKTPMMLSQEFLGMFRIQLTAYLGGVLDEDDSEILRLYGEDILNEARKQGVKV